MPDGRILARKLSCRECIGQGGLCGPCNENARVVYEPPLSLDEATGMEDSGALDEEEEDEHYVEPDPDEDEMDDDDGSCLDEGCGGDPEEDFEDEDEDGIGPGSVVWIRRREWFPGRVVDVHDLPTSSKKYLPEHPDRELIIALFPPLEEVVLVKRARVKALGENKDDKMRASRSERVNQAYNYALAVLRGDI